MRTNNSTILRAVLAATLLPVIAPPAAGAPRDSVTQEAAESRTAKPAEQSSEAKQEQDRAFARFKQGVEDAQQFARDTSPKTLDDGDATKARLRTTLEKFKAVETKGLPADVIAAYERMVAIVAELPPVYDEMFAAFRNRDAEQIQESEAEPFLRRLMEIQTRMKEAARTLRDRAAAYGCQLSPPDHGSGSTKQQQEQAPSTAPPLDANGAVALTLERSIPVGKWPEGVVVSHGDAYVAESGQRRVARIDLATGEVKARIVVGRLPVELATGPDGTVYVLVHTDRKLVAIDPKTNRARTVATLPDYPDGLVFADGALWVLLHHQGTTANSTVVRVNPASGKWNRSSLLGRDAHSLAVTQGRLWVSHGGPPSGAGRISQLDSTTLKILPDVVLPAPPWSLAATPNAVYAGLFTNEITRLDAKSAEQKHQSKVGAFIRSLLASGDDLFMATDDGMLRRLDAETMKVTAQYQLEKHAEASGMARSGPYLLVTHHDKSADQGDSAETGTLLVFRVPE